MLRKLKNSIFDLFLWFLWFPLRIILNLFPIKISYKLSCLIGQLSSYFLYSLKMKVAHELQNIFSDYYSKNEIIRIARMSIEIDLKRRIEELLLGQFTKDFIDEIISVDGKEFLEQSVKRGKGTIILLSHFGSYLFPLPILAFMGYRVNQLGGPPMLKSRSSIHKHIFSVKQKEYSNLPIKFLRSDLHMRAVIEKLNNNELVAIAFDGRESSSWSCVKFFNRDAYFASGVIKFAKKTGATILPTFIIRQKNDSHRLFFTNPFELQYDQNNENFLINNTQKLAEIFEKYISEYPSHFSMIMYIIKKRTEMGIIQKPFFSK